MEKTVLNLSSFAVGKTTLRFARCTLFVGNLETSTRSAMGLITPTQRGHRACVMPYGEMIFIIDQFISIGRVIWDGMRQEKEKD